MERKRIRTKLNKVPGFLKRALAFVLCLAAFFAIFYVQEPLEAEAALEGSYGVKAPDNAFILKISMGSVTTDQISYFALRYYDKSGIIHTSFITPTSESLLDGYAKVSKYIGNTTADSKLSFLGDYKSNPGNSMGYGYDSFHNSLTALKPMSTDYYYFELPYDFKSVAGLSFMARFVEGGNNEISIQDISLYKVGYFHDIDMVAGFSSEYYIDFTGISLMDTKIERTFTWIQADRVFDFGSVKYEDNSTVDFGTQYYSAKYIAEQYRETEHCVKYTVKIDISDVYGAGAEYLTSKVRSDGQHDTLYNGWLREPLELEVTYNDDRNVTHVQKVPVVLSALYKASSESGDVTVKSKLAGFLQQGESVVFDVIFTNTSKVDMTGFVLKYGRELVQKDIGFQFNSYSSWHSYKRDLKATSDDSIRIDAITVYDKGSCKYSASADSGFVVPTLTGNPKYYFTAFGVGGLEISEETVFTIPFSQYTGSEVITKPASDSKFLFKLKTDTPASASTSSYINVKIHYKSFSGGERVTESIELSSAASDFYGYWPTKSGNQVNFGYTAGCQSGGDLYFVADIPDVDSFIGMTVSLNSDATDDWQCSAVGIYEISGLGKRTAKWVGMSCGSEFSDRSFERDYTRRNISPTLNGAFLVEPGSPVYVEFSSGGSVIEDNDVDWQEYKYQMSYEDALQDMGFTKSRAAYNVKVKVAGDKVNGSFNEDCGSKNKFYFKLVFENGSTGYVLANQQLTSDGFTSGAEHVFTVISNQDLGNLTAIKILPENQNEESDVFDKLKIETVTVTKQGEAGLCLSWKVEINDWITIDYQDSGAKDSSRGQSGRSESELAQTFKVSSSGYSLNMMFAIETIGYIDTPFEGRVTAEIDYLDGKNSLRTEVIDDLVAQINNYNGKITEQKTYTPVNNNPAFDAAAIDRSSVLGENHTDRFFVSLDDAVSIVRIRLTVKSATAGRWKIGGVSVYRVLTKGTKIVNENNEYQYNGEVELVCQSNSDIPYDLQYIASGVAVPYNIVFGDNHIEVDLSNSWISSVSYVPQNDDDSINVYAYMSKQAKNIGAYNMKIDAFYGISDDTTRETVAVLSPDAKNNLFYALDIKVSGFRKLVKLGLKADSFETQYAPCDYVIIEHVRSGVVINTYYINYNGLNMDTGSMYYYAKPEKDTVHETERQTLTFMVSSDSIAAKLLNGTSDLAVSIDYISSNDPTGTVLTSPNLFVSDLGLTSIGPGDIITLTFDQKYVKDIKSISFIGQGAVANSIKIKAARVSTEQMDGNGEFSAVNLYSFGNEMNDFITFSPRIMIVTSSTSPNITVPQGTEKTVGILTLGFTTKEGTSGLGNGTSARVKIGYNDDYSMAKEIIISDLASYITSGSLNPGDTAVAKLLVNGIASIRYIEIEPYDNSASSAVWTIDSVYSILSTDADGVREERRVNKTVMEGTPETIGFGNVKIQVVAFISKDGTESLERRGFSSASDVSEGILLTGGNTIDCVVSIDGSISGMEVKCSSIAVTAEGNTVTSNVTNDVLTLEYGEDGMLSEFIFEPAAAGDYRITVSSQEISSVAVVINVSVT